MAAYIFLRANGLHLQATVDEAVALMLRIADKSADIEAIVDFLLDHVQ